MVKLEEAIRNVGSDDWFLNKLESSLTRIDIKKLDPRSKELSPVDKVVKRLFDKYKDFDFRRWRQDLNAQTSTRLKEKLPCLWSKVEENAPLAEDEALFMGLLHDKWLRDNLAKEMEKSLEVFQEESELNSLTCSDVNASLLPIWKKFESIMRCRLISDQADCFAEKFEEFLTRVEAKSSLTPLEHSLVMRLREVFGK